MTQTSDSFSEKLRTKVNDADKRLKDLSADAKTAGQKAMTDAKAQIASLDTKMKSQKAQLDASAAKAKTWAQQKAAVTGDKIAEWKARRELKKISDYADGAEMYAAATIDLAAAAVDEAERASVEAISARINADLAQV